MAALWFGSAGWAAYVILVGGMLFPFLGIYQIPRAHSGSCRSYEQQEQGRVCPCPVFFADRLRPIDQTADISRVSPKDQRGQNAHSIWGSPNTTAWWTPQRPRLQATRTSNTSAVTNPDKHAADGLRQRKVGC
jgi:hypothetical protein